MKLRMLFCILLLLPAWLIGQSGDHSVIGASGGTAKGQTMSLEWTLGETAISTIQHEQGLLTEGFHQPFLETELIETAALPASVQGATRAMTFLQLTAAPNPVAAQLQVEVQSDSRREGLLEIISTTGQRLSQQSVMLDFNQSVIEMGTYPGGTYFLLLRDEYGQILKTVKVIKIR